MKKRVFYTELSYVFGILVLALGTALMERADFGVSMVVAPAYLLHLKISESLPFFTFGMAEYTLQAVILLFMMIALHRVKLSYFFSFVTAVIYGFMLDGTIAAIALIPWNGMISSVCFYVVGMLFCSIGVSLLFHTYFSPEAYELFVKEISAKFHLDIHKCKTVYDCVSCGIAIVLSFAFFGLWQFEGVKWGTILCALINGVIIGWMCKAEDKLFAFKDGLKLRRFFEK